MSARPLRAALVGVLMAGAASVAVAGPAPAGVQADRLITAARAIPFDTRAKEAEAAWRAALAAAEAAYPAGHPQIGIALTEHALALQAVDDIAGAEKEMARAVAVLKAASDAPPAAVVKALINEGNLLSILGQNDRAEPLMREALAAQLRLDPKPSAMQAEIRFELGVLEQQLGRIPEALEEERTALNMRKALLKPGDPDLITSKMAYGNLLQNAGQLRDAETYVREAMGDAETYLPPDNATTVLAQQTLASLLRDLGRNDEAVAVQERAVARARAMDPNSDLLGQALGLLAVIRIDQGRPADAEAAFVQANEVLIKVHGHDSRVVALTLANAATAARQQDKNQVAADRYAECLAILARMGDPDPFLAAQTRQQRAIALDYAGHHDEALADARTAADWMKANLPDGDPRRMGAQVGYDWLVMRSGRTEEGARALAADADPVIADVASRALTPSQANVRRLKLNIDRVMVGLYVAGDMERGFRLAQLSMETEAGRAAAALTDRRAAGSDSLADLLRQRQTLGAAREKANAAYLMAVGGDAAKVAALTAELRARDAEVAAMDARLDRDFPNYRVLAAPQTLTVAEAQARLRPGEALVVPVLAGEDVITLAMTRTAAVWDRTPGETANARALIGRVRAGLGQGAGTRAAVDASGGSAPANRAGFDRQAAYELYQAIFTPKIQAAVKGSSQLSIAASPALSATPFAVLVTARPKGDDRDPAALRATPWLIRAKAVQTVPAIRAMRPGAATSDARASFFGAGAPTLHGSAPVKGAAAYYRDGKTDLTSLKSLPPLPAAEGELEAMAKALGGDGSRVLVGDVATEAAVKSADLSHARIVAFATHGLVGGDLSGLAEPGLVFTPPEVSSDLDDGVLTASEASQLKLDADWVILSACNTAAGETANAPGYTGLARAFIFAGGRRVLASHWPVRDDAAARLTVETVRATAKGAAPGRALQQAMLKLIDDRSVPGGSDPSVWAPFVLIGR